MRSIVTSFLILATAILAEARISRYWTDQELCDKADLVVIAKPISTQETTEEAVLPECANVHVIGLSTEFDVFAVMRGDRELKKVVLHHYRLADPKRMMINAPHLASFDPKLSTRYLMFLHREADGRYSPVAGQTDPAGKSVFRLQ